MDLTEKKLSGELKYTGVIVSVTLDKVELCDGHQTLREVVHHPGGVGVLTVAMLMENVVTACERQLAQNH